MVVHVISKSGKPLMPCKPVVARLLLKDGKAKVKSRMPFTIKLLVDSGEYIQPVTAGMDTGSKTIGCAAVANGNVKKGVSRLSARSTTLIGFQEAVH